MKSKEYMSICVFLFITSALLAESRSIRVIGLGDISDSRFKYTMVLCDGAVYMQKAIWPGYSKREFWKLPVTPRFQTLFFAAVDVKGDVQPPFPRPESVPFCVSYIYNGSEQREIRYFEPKHDVGKIMLEIRNGIINSKSTILDLNSASLEVKECMDLPLDEKCIKEFKRRHGKILENVMIKILGVDAKYVTLEITNNRENTIKIDTFDLKQKPLILRFPNYQLEINGKRSLLPIGYCATGRGNALLEIKPGDTQTATVNIVILKRKKADAYRIMLRDEESLNYIMTPPFTMPEIQK